MVHGLRLQGVFQCIHDLLLRDGVMAASQVRMHHRTDTCIRQSIALAQQCMYCRPAMQFVPLAPSSDVCLAPPPCSHLPNHFPLGHGAPACRLQVHTPPALPSRAMLEIVSKYPQPQCTRPAPSQADAAPQILALPCCIVKQQSAPLCLQTGHLTYSARHASNAASSWQTSRQTSSTKRYTLQAHDPAYVERFCSGALDDAAVKRIGFGAVTRSPVLVERTLAEIAGVRQLLQAAGVLRCQTSLLPAAARCRRPGAAKLPALRI
jgi:hypothetical protein